MLTYRSIAKSEIWYLQCKSMVQMSIEVDKPSKVPEVVNKLRNRAIGLSIKMTDDSLVYTDANIDVYKIPNSVGNCKEASEWAQKHAMPDLYERIGTISANDRFVTLNMNHIVSDGGYLQNLHRSLDDDHIAEESHGYLPLPLEYFYAKRVAEQPINTTRVYNDASMTRALTTRRKDPIKGANMLDKVHFIPVEELQCFSKEKKAPHKLTESIWTSYCLAAMSFNDKISDFGCSTCVNMRNLINNSQRLDVCNHFSALTTLAKTHKNSTLKSIGEEMRKDMNTKLQQGALFAFMKACEENAPLIELPGVGMQMTSPGIFRFKKPFVDCYIGMTMNSDYSDSTIPLMVYSVITEDKNEIALRLMYGPNKVEEKEAASIARKIVHLMKNVPVTATVEEAFNEIKLIE